MDAKAGETQELSDYYAGQQPIAFVAPEVRLQTEGRLTSLVVNYPRRVVDAVAQRLAIGGFSVNRQHVPRLWELWRQTGMDTASEVVNVEALVSGRSYVIVWADSAGNPTASAHSAAECFVLLDPGSRARVAAVRRWQETPDLARLVFFEPTRVRTYTTGSVTTAASGWEQTNTYPNPFGVVPVVPFVNRGRLSSMDGESEMADVLPIADAINKISTDMMTASEFAALPRRWATGVQLPETVDSEGEPTGEVDTSQMFSQAVARVWAVEESEAKLGQFPEAQLMGFTTAMKQLVQALGAMSGLPPHFLGIGTDQLPSGDSRRAAESALVGRVYQVQRSFGPSYAEVMRLLSAADVGFFDPALNTVETQWRDAENVTDASLADAVTKLYGSGLLPYRAALAKLGYAPDQIDQFQAQRTSEAIESAAVKLAG
jgi:hypothetical protein